MKKKRKYINDTLLFSSPKYMCINCFRVFSKRYGINSSTKQYSNTQRCICGSDDLVRLDREVLIPRKKASNKKWEEFFRENYLSRYYKRFKESRNK